MPPSTPLSFSRTKFPLHHWWAFLPLIVRLLRFLLLLAEMLRFLLLAEIVSICSYLSWVGIGLAGPSRTTGLAPLRISGVRACAYMRADVYFCVKMCTHAETATARFAMFEFGSCTRRNPHSDNSSVQHHTLSPSCAGDACERSNVSFFVHLALSIGVQVASRVTISARARVCVCAGGPISTQGHCAFVCQRRVQNGAFIWGWVHI